MFIRSSPSEMITIAKGLLIMMIAISTGLSAAERQLNTLTQRQDGVQVFNVSRDPGGGYSFCVLGENFAVNAIYPVARVSQSDHGIMIEAAGKKLEMPAYINVDISQGTAMYHLWHKQFMDEAFKCKNDLEKYAEEAARKIAGYLLQHK
jgi:hypothetical protein